MNVKPAPSVKLGVQLKMIVPLPSFSAAAMFKKLSFSTSQIGAMAALVDVDKMTHEDAAKKWLKDNEKVWKAFTK